tara:strand:- start:3188 stop:4096 length:909 start_codon:yes stop_codon:yes gene_type:complete
MLNTKTLLISLFFSLSLFSKNLKNLSHNIKNKGFVDKIYDFQSNYVEDRPMYIWLPSDFDPYEKHNLLIMHDGQNLFDGTKTWNSQEWELDEWSSKLISENQLSSFIIVGIHNSGKNRWSDYFPEKAYKFITDLNYLSVIKPELNADSYLKYIVKEVIPFVKEKYLKSTYDYKTIIGGSSMGGLISMYATFEYPEVFDGAICISTHWPGVNVTENNPVPEAIFKYMRENIPIPKNKKFYFDYGDKGLDKNYPQYSKTIDSLFLNNEYQKWNFKNLFFKNHGHSEEYWAKRIQIPLKFMFNKN